MAAPQPENMPLYKKQHYLPSAYLRNFSIDGPVSTRKSKIWRFDAKARRLVTVESEGFSSYYYSDQAPEKVEKEFEAGEDFYAECYSDFWKCDAPSTSRRAFGLLVMMLDLHIRNIAYAKATRNNYADYLEMSATVKHKILWGRQEAPADDNAIANEAYRNWRVGFIRCDSSHVFLTSDNPSLLAKVGHGRAFVNMVLMPVTPHTYAVGYDSRELKLNSNTVSESDEIILTHLQMKNCLQCVYAREDISDEQWDGLKEFLAKRPPRLPIEGPGLWGADIFPMPARCPLGFMGS
jgi:hypothetical protein